MKKTILLVEDEALLAMSQQMELENYGYVVLTANSGKEAIETYFHEPENIDLILMDINLGSGMDGTETAQQILNEHEVPIVFLSSHTGREIVEKTEKITSYGYVVKNSGMTVLDASIKMAFKLFDEKIRVEKSEQQFHQLFNSMKEGVAIYLPIENGDDFEIVDINNSGLRSTAQIREEIIGQKVTDVFPSVRDIGVFDALREVHISGEPKTLPIAYYKDHQIDFWVENHVFRLPSGLIVAVFEDVSEKHRIQEELLKSEEKFRAIFRKSPYAIGLTEIDSGICIDVNDLFSIKTGFAKEEAIGKTTTELGFYLEEDRNRFISELANKGFIDGLEMEFNTKNGTLQTKMFANIIESDGKQIIMTMFEDITERKQYEKDLVFHSMVLDQIKENIIVTDLSGVVTYANEAAEKMLGKPKSEIIGQPTMIFGEDPERGATQNEIIEKTLKEGFRHFEVVNFDADNNEHIMDCRAQVVTDEKGKPVALCGISSEITEKRHIEETLKNEQTRFKNLAELLPDVVFEMDTQLNLTFANEVAFQLFGYTKADFDKGVNASQMIAPESHENALININKILSGNKLGLQEYVAITKDGFKFPVLIHSNPILQNGSVTGLRGVLTDITKRKNAEEKLKTEHLRLQSIIEGTNVGTWEWNVQTGETIFNEKWANIIGYHLEELKPISIETWIENTHPDDLAKSDELLKKHFNGELDYYQIEVRMKHKGGNYVWVLDKGKVISWTDDGNPLLMYGTHTDITEIKRREEELENAYQEKNDLLKELQHRVKNSFALLNGVVRLMKNSNSGASVESALSEIESRIDAVSKMYELLYDTQSVSEVDLSLYLKNVIDGLEVSNIIITRELLPIALSAKIAIPIGIITTELITNSIKHAFPENKKGNISLSLKKLNQKAILEIRDDGVGIPKNFDPSKSNTLGLQLVYALSSQVAGSISFNAENGTHWILEFPIE